MMMISNEKKIKKKKKSTKPKKTPKQKTTIDKASKNQIFSKIYQSTPSA